jgi:hypothetical protein
VSSRSANALSSVISRSANAVLRDCGRYDRDCPEPGREFEFGLGLGLEVGLGLPSSWPSPKSSNPAYALPLLFFLLLLLILSLSLRGSIPLPLPNKQRFLLEPGVRDCCLCLSFAGLRVRYL